MICTLELHEEGWLSMGVAGCNLKAGAGTAKAITTEDTEDTEKRIETAKAITTGDTEDTEKEFEDLDFNCRAFPCDLRDLCGSIFLQLLS